MYYSSPPYYQTRSGGLPAFQGGVMQKGYGLQGIFEDTMRNVARKLDKGLAQVWKQALKTGLKSLGDVAAEGV